MKSLSLLFVALSLLVVSCQEQDEPETIYGRYVVQSILSDQALDIPGTGETSVDLLKQFEAIGIRQNSIFLSLYSPRDFQVGYSQVTFAIPFQGSEDQKLGLGNGSFGRRIDFSNDGNASLDWSLAPDFEEPYQLHQTITVKDIQLIDDNGKTIELVLDQSFFDQNQKSWVGVKVTYSLQKENL